MKVPYKENTRYKIRHTIYLILIFLSVFFTYNWGISVQTVQSMSPNPSSSGSEKPGSTASSGAQQPIVTQLTSSGRTVKLNVNIVKDSQISSGRIKIYYPQEFLHLTDAQSGKLWELEDINKELPENGQNVVSFAWADTKEFTGEGNLLTVTWEALDAASGREVAVETEIVELYAKTERMEVKTEWMIDRIKPSFPISSTVRTGDNTNAAALGLLCLSSALLMARMLRKKFG